MRITSCLLASFTLFGCAEDEPSAPEPDLLALPGQAYFPESLHADDDGTLYVGSLATGEVVAYDRGATEPRGLIAAGQHGITGVTGVLVQGDELWLCSVDTTFQRPTEVRSFTLAGAPIASYPQPANAFCNDLVFDADGTLYMSDSFGGVRKLAPGAEDFVTFAEDPRFIPDAQGAFGLDGLAFLGDTLYVNKFDTGELFAIAPTGAITEIVVTPALVSPDGMRTHGDVLLVVEGAGRLTEVAISGATATATAIAGDLDMPTSVVVARDSAWVSEGQLGRLFSQQNPNLPFAVRRIDL
jgi:outer membrane protein assembly factor BamB